MLFRSVIGKDSREGVLIVKTIIGYLSILASKVEKIGVSNEEIEAGDWIEVLEILEEDSHVNIDKGYVTQVTDILSDDGVEIRTKNGDTWWLHPFQIKKVDAPKFASAENPNENSETLETKEQAYLKYLVDMYSWSEESTKKLFALKSISEYARTLIKQMEEEE